MLTYRPRVALTKRTVVLLAAAAAFMIAGDASAQSSTAAPKKSASAKKATASKSKAAKKVAAKPALPMRFVITPTGNEARYRVREQLVGVNLPNDAVGVTSEVSGTILAYADGRVVRDSSRITVKLANLKSDKDRRDGYLQRRTLETDKFPTVELVPTSVRGFTGPLPVSGPIKFELLGDLTVHGVTRPTVWQVIARAEGQDVAGTATTAFTFADVNLTQPKVSVVLSVSDTIQLEYDFRFVREAAKP